MLLDSIVILPSQGTSHLLQLNNVPAGYLYNAECIWPHMQHAYISFPCASNTLRLRSYMDADVSVGYKVHRSANVGWNTRRSRFSFFFFTTPNFSHSAFLCPLLCPLIRQAVFFFRHVRNFDRGLTWTMTWMQIFADYYNIILKVFKYCPSMLLFIEY